MAPSASMAKRLAEDAGLDPSSRPSKRVHQERIEYHDLDTRMNMMTEQIKELNELLGCEQGYRRDMQIYLTRTSKEQIEKEVKEGLEDIKRELKREQKSRDDELAMDMAQKAAEDHHKQLRDELMSMVANHKKDAEEVQQRNEEKQKTLETKNQNILNELKSLSSKYETTVKTIAQHAQEAQQDRKELQRLRDEDQQIRNQHDILLRDCKTAHDLVSQEAQQIRNDLEALRTKSQEDCDKFVKEANQVILDLQKETKDLKTQNIMLQNKQTALDNKCQLLEEKNSRLEKLHSNAALTHVSPNSHVTPAVASYPSPGSESMQQQSFGSSTTSIATTTTMDFMDQTPNQPEPEETMHDVSDGDISGDEKPAEQMSVPPFPMDIDSTNNTPCATGYSASSSGSFGKPSMPLFNGPHPPTGPSAQSGVRGNYVRSPQPTLHNARPASGFSVAPTQPSFSTTRSAAPLPTPTGPRRNAVPHQSPIPPPPSAGRPFVSSTLFAAPGPKPQKHVSFNSFNPPNAPKADREAATYGNRVTSAFERNSETNFWSTRRNQPKERSASPVDSRPRERIRSPSPDRRRREETPFPDRRPMDSRDAPAAPAGSFGGRPTKILTGSDWKQGLAGILNEARDGDRNISQRSDVHNHYAGHRANNDQARSNDHSRRSNASLPFPRGTTNRKSPTTNNESRPNRRSNDQSRPSNVLPSNGDRRAWSINNESRTGRRNNHHSNGGFHQSNMMPQIDEEEEGGGEGEVAQSIEPESIEKDDNATPMSENKRGKKPMQNGYAYDSQPADADKPLGKKPLDKSQAYASHARFANDDDDDEADDETGDFEDEDEDDEDEDEDDDDHTDADEEEEQASKYGNMSSGGTHYGQSSATRPRMIESVEHLSQRHEAYNPTAEAEDDLDYEDGSEVLHT